MTKKEYFAQVRNIVDAQEFDNKTDVLAFIDHEIEMLEKKSSSKKPTANQKANVAIKEAILKALTEQCKPMTVTEILAIIDYTEPLTNQRTSALLRQMVENGDVIKTIEKRKSYFSAA